MARIDWLQPSPTGQYPIGSYYGGQVVNPYAGTPAGAFPDYTVPVSPAPTAPEPISPIADLIAQLGFEPLVQEPITAPSLETSLGTPMTGAITTPQATFPSPSLSTLGMGADFGDIPFMGAASRTALWGALQRMYRRGAYGVQGGQSPVQGRQSPFAQLPTQSPFAQILGGSL